MPAFVVVVQAVSAVGVVVSAVQSFAQVVVPAVGVASLVPEVELAVVAFVSTVLVVQAALPFVFQVVVLVVSVDAFVVVV